MGSVTRASSFWSEVDIMQDHDLEDVEDQTLLSNNDQVGDGRTRLDRTIDRIGMGSYQWTLLSLCGFGWMADNMWIQAIAIILPRVQQHYSVPDNYIGAVSSSMFAGMMFGAVGWGTCSDLMGRSAAFNATLFFTSLFGLLASVANSFGTLCVLLFFLGSAVGGSMPTDGTLLLEHMPQGKQYLVTALSVFFSFGAVLAAVVALLIVPQHSCPHDPSIACDVDAQNMGWKYLLISLGLITLTMFLARMVFFRLHESPRYLVHAGRPQEALESLQMISKFNGSALSLALEDVDDQQPQRVFSPRTTPRGDEDEASTPFLHRKSEDGVATGVSETIFDAAENAEFGAHSRMDTQSSSNYLNDSARADPVVHYSSTGESHTPLGAHTFATPTVEYEVPFSLTRNSDSAEPESNAERTTHFETSVRGSTSRSHSPDPIAGDVAPARPRPRSNAPRLSESLGRRRSGIRSNRQSRRASSVYEKRVCALLPSFIRRPLWAWWDRVMLVLTPEWLKTTLLVWAAWCAMSLAYTMFNVFLPKLLESSSSSSPSGPDGGAIPAPVNTLEESLWDVVIFTLGGCPGAILGAYMVETPLGRRWSLASSTFVTAFFCVVFVLVESSWAIRASTVGISLSATTMWAVLYGWTPEIFGTEVRGTACGIASALSRIGGMIAPILGGMLLMINRSVPVYTSVVVFCVAGFCVLLLKEDAGDGGRKGERVIVH